MRPLVASTAHSELRYPLRGSTVFFTLFSAMMVTVVSVSHRPLASARDKRGRYSTSPTPRKSRRYQAAPENATRPIVPLAASDDTTHFSPGSFMPLGSI